MQDQDRGDRHDEIIRMLSELKINHATMSAQGTGIIQRLDKINGSYGKLFETVDRLKNELLEHQIECPVRNQVCEIKNQLATGEHHGSLEVKAQIAELMKIETIRNTTAENNERWLRRLWPAFCFIAFIEFLLVLAHAPWISSHMGIK